MEPPKDVGQAHESQQGQQEEPLKNGEKPEESVGAHSASSSSTPPEPDDGSTNVPQPPPVDWNYLMNKDYAADELSINGRVRREVLNQYKYG